MQFAPKYQVRGEVTTQKWLGSAHATDNARTVTIQADSLKKYAAKGYVPAGTPLAVGEKGKFKIYTEGPVAGFLLVDQPFDGVHDVVAPLLDHGRIRVDYLPEGTPNITAENASTFILVKEAK